MDGDLSYTDSSENEQSQGNPAWNEFLQVVPQELHSQVTPLLEKWDRGVEERFNKVHSEYEPWKPIIKSGNEPDQVQWALNLLGAVNENPRMVYDALGEHYKFAEEKAPSGQGQPESQEENPYDARFASIEHQNQIMAQHILNQREEQLRREAEVQLDEELSGLKKKYGDYDEQFVLAKMQNGLNGEQAVQAYVQWRDAQLKQLGSHLPKPLIGSGGGGFPQQNVDVRKMSDKQAREYAMQILQANAAQRD